MFTTANLLDAITQDVERPISEIFIPGFSFCDYRLSYGVHCHGPETVYFMAIYPAFCLNPKAVLHYANLEALHADLNHILDFLIPVPPTDGPGRKVETRDIIAAVFAIQRGKESIELFQEQKDFMDFGVQHVHLDNFYQDFIKKLCLEFFATGTLMGHKLSLSFIPEPKTEA